MLTLVTAGRRFLPEASWRGGRGGEAQALCLVSAATQPSLSTPFCQCLALDEAAGWELSQLQHPPCPPPIACMLMPCAASGPPCTECTEQQAPAHPAPAPPRLLPPGLSKSPCLCTHAYTHTHTNINLHPSPLLMPQQEPLLVHSCTRTHTHKPAPLPTPHTCTQAVLAAGEEGLALPLGALSPLDVEEVRGGGEGVPPATATLMKALSDRSVHVHLPFGQGLGVLLRFGRLFRIRCVWARMHVYVFVCMYLRVKSGCVCACVPACACACVCQSARRARACACAHSCGTGIRFWPLH